MPEEKDGDDVRILIGEWFSLADQCPSVQVPVGLWRMRICAASHMHDIGSARPAQRSSLGKADY
jgi:hypothetical protein